MATSDLIDFLIIHNLYNTDANNIIRKMQTSDSHSEFMTYYENLIQLLCGPIDIFTLGGEKRLQKGTLANPEYARKGFHVIRTWAANLAHEKRILKYSNNSKISHKFMYDGIIKIENFIPNFEKVEEKIQKEFKNFPTVVHKRLDNICYRNKHQAPNLNEIFQQIVNTPDIESVLGARVGSPIRNFFKNALLANTFYQRVYNTPDDNDNQKNLHIDTFFPALKFWWFSQDVSENDGAFVYVRKSVDHTTEYYNWLYEQSIKICEKNYDNWRLRDHEEGSLRGSEDELSLMKLNAISVEVKKNTLVLGNVGGFHGRGNTKKPFTRNSIHGSIRLSDPYSF